MTKQKRKQLSAAWLAVICLGILATAGWMQLSPPDMPSGGAAATEVGHIRLWAPLRDDTGYATYEKIALIANVFVALAGLIYALLLVRQVREAPQGTPKMQE